MPFDIGALAQETAGGVIGTGMGLLLEKHNDERQIRQQGKLTQQQLAAQKEMGEFNYRQQMKLWEATGYGAQIDQMRRAGVNPGLIYGMKGGGGQTAAAQPGNVGAPEAPKGGGEAITGAGMGIQMALLQAQIQNIQAQTKKTEVETTKTAGVDTTEAETRIASLSEGIENQRSVRRLMAVETELKEIEKEIQGATKEEQIMSITMAASHAKAIVDILENDVTISKATLTTKIKQIAANLAGTIAANQLTRAQTNVAGEQSKLIGQQTLNTEADRRNIKAKFGQWVEQNYIDLQNMTTEERYRKIAEELKDQKLETQGIEIITQAVDGIFRRMGQGGTPTRNPVGYK